MKRRKGRRTMAQSEVFFWQDHSIHPCSNDQQNQTEICHVEHWL